MCVSNMCAIPCQQILGAIYDGNSYMVGIRLRFRRQRMILNEGLSQPPNFGRNLEQWQVGDYR